MFIKRYGNGDRCFFGLHGWSGDHSTFEPLVPYLPGDATLFSVDLPSCGRSSPPREWTLEGLAGEVAEEVKTIGSSRVCLIGNCSGAILGLVAYPEIADLINRIVMIDPFAYVPWYFKVFVSKPIGKYAYYSTFANPIGRWITNLSLKNHRTEETDLTESFRSVDHEASFTYLRLLTAIDGVSEFAAIDETIDIVYGEKTFGAIRRSIGMWRGIWPQARMHELKGAGHLPIIEAPEELSGIIFK